MHTILQTEMRLFLTSGQTLSKVLYITQAISIDLNWPLPSHALTAESFHPLVTLSPIFCHNSFHQTSPSLCCRRHSADAPETENQPHSQNKFGWAWKVIDTIYHVKLLASLKSNCVFAYITTSFKSCYSRLSRAHKSKILRIVQLDFYRSYAYQIEIYNIG